MHDVCVVSSAAVLRACYHAPAGGAAMKTKLFTMGMAIALALSGACAPANEDHSAEAEAQA